MNPSNPFSLHQNSKTQLGLSLLLLPIQSLVTVSLNLCFCLFFYWFDNKVVDFNNDSAIACSTQLKFVNVKCFFFFFNGLDSKRNLSGSILMDSKFEPNSENTLMVVAYKYTNTNYLYNDYKFSLAFHPLNKHKLPI